MAAAAATGLIFGVGATWAATRHGTASPGQRGQVSVAALAPLDVPQASGNAVLRVVSASQRTITVSVANSPSEPATTTRYG